MIKRIGEMFALPKSDGTTYAVHPLKIGSVQSTDHPDQCSVSEINSRYFCRVNLAPEEVQEAIADYFESL
jgi:hypothetical protein